jgi:predicted RNase H-like nuclease
VRTLGIDLATRNGATGVCEIDWDARARVVSVMVGSPDDDELVDRVRSAIKTAGWVAIDAPFGFPRAFTEALAAWSADRPIALAHLDTPDWLSAEAPWDPINRRLTDGYVHMRLREAHAPGDPSITWPLSAVVERITPTVIRCAELLSRTTSTIDRIGFGSRIVEVYPVAALRLWGFATAGYKGKHGGSARQQLLHRLGQQAPWLDLDGFEESLVASDDSVDALICALLARLAAHPDRISGPSATDLPMDVETISAEGWIHLPPASHPVGALLAGEFSPSPATRLP